MSTTPQSPEPQSPEPQQTGADPDEHLIIQGHEYDGITEYDNPMPSWWLYTFYATIAWSVLYVAGIQLGFINTYGDDLHESNRRIDAMQARAVADRPEVTAEYLAGLVGDAAMLDRGASAFAMSCAACHGNEGQGLIGPNLTDEYWLHGGELLDIYRVADVGVPAKGMPAWGQILSHDDLVGVTLYIDSLRGTNPPNPKAPEGEPMVE